MPRSAASFDGEACRSRRRRGSTRACDRADPYGRLLGQEQNKKPTGSPAGWTLAGGTASRLARKGIKRGFLSRRFWYLRDLDPHTILATGLTRDCTFCRNGEITPR